MNKNHPGFESAAAKIAKNENLSIGHAKAILASGARDASAHAKKANPRLNKVKG